MSVNVISELVPLLLPQPGELKAAYAQTFHGAPSKTPKSSLTQFPRHTQKSSIFSWLSSPSPPHNIPELVLVRGRAVGGARSGSPPLSMCFFSLCNSILPDNALKCPEAPEQVRGTAQMKRVSSGLPGGPVVKNLPSKAGDVVRSLVGELGSQMLLGG